MALYRPNMYKKNIFEIDYDILKKKKIKCLVFDLDNTLGLIDEKECPKEVKKLLNKLKKDFTIYISSNNVRKRILPYIEDLEIEGESFSLKPLPKGLIRISKRSGFKNYEIAMIGDQMVTDILSGNLFGAYTILVDPLGMKDLKITGLNRKIESLVCKRYDKLGIFKKGSYYE